MKTNSKLLSLIFTVILFTACSTTTNFYQVYTTKPISDLKITDQNIVFEDENCRIIYDFWGKSGNLSFVFQNKTNELITIKKDQCYYILNGFAFDYYKNRTYSSSTSTQLTTEKSAAILVSVTGLNFEKNIQSNQLGVQNSGAISNSNSKSINTPEELAIKIPAKSAKEISEFSIYDGIYRDCDLLRFPKNKKEYKTLQFTKDDSPIQFSNIIVYTKSNLNSIKIENSFFVSEITNLPESEMSESKIIENCKESSYYPVQLNKRKQSNYFYNIYPYEIVNTNSYTPVWKY